LPGKVPGGARDRKAPSGNKYNCPSFTGGSRLNAGSIRYTAEKLRKLRTSAKFENLPQGLKPDPKGFGYRGTAQAVPFQSTGSARVFFDGIQRMPVRNIVVLAQFTLPGAQEAC
jgi:hypothetical protein